MKKKEEETEDTDEAQKKRLVDKAQRTSLERPCVGKERRRCTGERQRGEQKSQGETSSGKSGRWLYFLLIFDAKLVVY